MIRIGILSIILMVIGLSCKSRSSLKDLKTNPNENNFVVRVEAIPLDSSLDCLKKEHFETLKYLNPFDGQNWLRVSYSPCLKFNIIKTKANEHISYFTRTMYASQIPEIAQDLFCASAQLWKDCLKRHEHAIFAAVGYFFHLIFPHQSHDYDQFSPVREIKTTYISEREMKEKPILELIKALTQKNGNGHHLFTVPVQAWVSLLVSNSIVYGAPRLSRRRISAQRIIRNILKRKLAEAKEFVIPATLANVKEFSRNCARFIEDACLTFPCSIKESNTNNQGYNQARRQCITPVKNTVQFYTTHTNHVISIPMKLSPKLSQDNIPAETTQYFAKFKIRNSTPPQVVIDPLWANNRLETLMEFYDIRLESQ